MTIPRTKTWAFGEKVTSTQLNQLDTSPTYALDKRAGQTDTLLSVVSCSGAGRVIGAYAVGADAATTYLITGGNSTIDVPTLTANRTYTLGTAGAQAGDVIFVVMRNTGFVLTIVDGATTSTLATMTLGSVNSLLGDSTWGEFLYTGSVWVRCAGDALRSQISWTFKTSGSWVCPPGLQEVRVECWGGGGGGGGSGTSNNSAAATPATGGGGGGGAIRVCGRIRVSPGTTYTLTIGGGGASGAVGSSGGDGGDTIFANGGTSLVVATGAQGGALGVNASNAIFLAKGGAPIRLASGANRQINSGDPYSLTAFSGVPGNGGAGGGFGSGFGGQLGQGQNGVSSSEGQLGGTGGTQGANVALSYCGGGGGGGGGGGPTDATAGVPLGTNGATGGAGGAANGAGFGTAGTAGSNAVANSGAGGGGGGAGGNGSSGGGTGAAGGTGGSGLLVIYGVH